MKINFHILIYNPRAFSKASSLVLQAIHNVVTGLALRRLAEILSPHFSQIPNVPSSIRAKAFFIFLISLFSLSLIRYLKPYYLHDLTVLPTGWLKSL